MTAARRIRVDVELGDAGRVRLDLADPTDAQIAGVTELLRRWLDGDDYDEPAAEQEPEVEADPDPFDRGPDAPKVARFRPFEEALARDAAAVTDEVLAAVEQQVHTDPVPELPPTPALAKAPTTWSCDECNATFTRPQGLGAHRRYKHGPPATPRASAPELGELAVDDGRTGDDVDLAGDADLEPRDSSQVDDQDEPAADESDDLSVLAGGAESVGDTLDVVGVGEADEGVVPGDAHVDGHAPSVQADTDSPALCRCGHALRMHERDDIADQGRGQCFRLSCGCAEYRAAS